MKKIIFAVAILSAAVMTGCSLSFDGTDSSQPAENVQGSENAVTTQGTDTESEEAADPLEEAKDVAAMYLKAANAEFDQSMVKLMTDDYAADYEYMKKNMGGDNEYGETSIELAPSLSRAPQLLNGSCVPNPKKLRKDSNRIMLGTSNEAYTTTTPSTFGTIWRITIRTVDTPPTCAASINSLRLRLSVCPRTIRAISSQETIPIATKISRIFCPKKVTSRITKNMNGKELRISSRRIITESIFPPR